MLGPGPIEWGSKRSALEKFAYTAGDLALCVRHQGEWVGLMKVPHLQFGISDAALIAASDEPNGEVELRLHRKFADSRLGTLATVVHGEMIAGFPSGRLFLDSIEQAMAVALVSSQAEGIVARGYPAAVAVACGFKTQQHFAQVFRDVCGFSPTRYRQDFLGYEATGASETCSEGTSHLVNRGSQSDFPTG